MRIASALRRICTRIFRQQKPETPPRYRRFIGSTDEAGRICLHELDPDQLVTTIDQLPEHIRLAWNDSDEQILKVAHACLEVLSQRKGESHEC